MKPFLALVPAVLLAQPYDMLLKRGHVIDPANRIDGIMDVAIAGNKIARVAPDIPAGDARQVIDASGLYVTPGLIDLHAHVTGYSGALLPDDSALTTGTTTVVDAGGSGWRSFDDWRSKIVDRAKTRVLVLLNIVGAGMQGEKAESNTGDMDPTATADKIKANRDVIVGIKTAHFGLQGWTAIDRAVAAGRLADVPVMVDDKIFTNTGRTTRDKLLDHLRPGDIHTHTFNDRQVELVDRFSGKVQPYIWEARRRGVLFDMGHGAGSFLWPVASKAMQQGFAPDTISTDLHAQSILIPQSDMPNCISKMLLLGMSLTEAILRSTVNPARAVRRFPELGTLTAGSIADVSIFELQHGVFAFKDAWHHKRLGDKKLECVLTVRDGRIAFDRDGRGFPAWSGSPRQQPVATPVTSEIYDLLLKNGNVIDPANRRNGRWDVAVIGNKIARVAKDLPASHARVVVDASRYYVTPGLIDIHTHFDAGGADLNIQPDHNALPSGVTTAVDAGSSGWKNFESFKSRVIDRAKTRILAFLNIVGAGMYGEKVENDVSEMDAEAAARTARKYPRIIVGIKTAHFQPATWDAVDRAVKAAELSQTIVMVDFHPKPGREYPELVVQHMRPGDIHTHVYGRLIPQLDAAGNVQPYMWEARKRGVLFDAGHGSGSFWFRIAAPAVIQGFLPDTISTDIHKNSIMLPRANMITTISKFLNIGMTLEQVIERSTAAPAKAIRRPELGTLSEGGPADIAVLELQRGAFGFLDSGLEKHLGDRKLRCVLTVRAGEVVWDSEGLSLSDASAAGPYSNFK